MSDIDMRRRFARNFAAATLLVALTAILAPAAIAAGDPDAGLQLAQRWCTGCHVVDSAGHGTDAAPAFATVARSRTDQRWVRAWLYAPHPPMPNLNLSRSEVDDVIAYLGTLAKK